VLTCDRCDAPMVLHAGRSGDVDDRAFECHRCGRVRDAKTICDVCGGWRLYAYGMGVEKISEVLKRYKKEVPTFVLSHDTAKSHGEAVRTVAAWEASGRGVLVGTARALPYLRFAPPATSIIASFETLLMLPDIYMQERLFNLLSFTREVTAKRVIVQTRSPDHETLKQGLAGDGLSFFKAEDERRKMFSYPPYAVPVKITLQGREGDVMAHFATVKERFAPYTVSVYPAFVSKVKGRFVAHALFSVPTANWPDANIVKTLRELPPAYRIDVAPESLL
jgi:primosomal protein N' (replication factor Y)